MRPRVGLLIAAMLAIAAAPVDAQLIRRSRGTVCPPVSHHQQVHHDNDDDLLIVQQEDIVTAAVLELLTERQLLESQAASITVQNNFNAFPNNLGTTLYGYAAYPTAANPASPFTAPSPYSPYTIDPGSMMREAQRMADRAGDLHGQAVSSYERLGTLALTTGSQADTIRAQTEQLRAQAELIRASTPPPAAQQSTLIAPLSAPALGAQPQVQRLTSGTQSICITPDGSGGFRITLDDGSGHQQLAAPAGQPVGPEQGSIARGIAILQTHCASCHTGDSSKGKFIMFDDIGLTKDAINQLDRIFERASNTTMPPDPLPKLTDREIAELSLLLPE